MKKRSIIIFSTLLLVSLLSGCCFHEWQEATCTRPKTCSLCEKTVGERHEPVWEEATCNTPKHCTLCGNTQGVVLGHDLSKPTCSQPATCSRCDLVIGEVHTPQWKEATCTDPKTCTICKATEGEALGHDYQEATLTEPSTCLRCQKTQGKPATVSDYARDGKKLHNGEHFLFTYSQFKSLYESVDPTGYLGIYLNPNNTAGQCQYSVGRLDGSASYFDSLKVFGDDPQIVTLHYDTETDYVSKIVIELDYSNFAALSDDDLKSCIANCLQAYLAANPPLEKEVGLSAFLDSLELQYTASGAYSDHSYEGVNLHLEASYGKLVATITLG